MKLDPQLHNFGPEGGSKPRMSRRVVAPMLIAAGVIGLPLAFGLSQCSRSPNQNDWSSGSQTVNTETAYPNNHFLPGAGYYHAPYHMWFPLPFNSYQAGQGWYRGGGWRATAEEDEEERRAQSNGVAGRGTSGTSAAGFARMQSSRPTAEAVQRANASAAAHAGPVMRGGFGQSSHPGIS